jgi:Holliday junction resolvasome RuvABC endonuclease subunit
VIVLGVDIGTKRLGLALIRSETGKLHAHYALELLRDPVNRLAAAYDQATLLAAPNVAVFMEEPPYVRNVDTFRKLCEVAGAFRAGCTHAHWTMDFTQSEWKLASVGRGVANKRTYVAWAQTTYHVQTTDDDICAAIGIAHAGRAWWNSQRKDGAA